MAAIPYVLKIVPDVLFRIVGDDTISMSDRPSYKQQFLAKYGNQRVAKRVKFEGKVSEEILQEAYACCDIFVAPSRFRSFGWVSRSDACRKTGYWLRVVEYQRSFHTARMGCWSSRAIRKPLRKQLCSWFRTRRPYQDGQGREETF